jgi:hypothetical protein
MFIFLQYIQFMKKAPTGNNKRGREREREGERGGEREKKVR